MTGLLLYILFGVVQIAAKPNFLIILADDLGYGDLSQPGVDLPHFDWLRQHSVEFTQTYAADSVCTPSRCAILTGRYPIRSGMANDVNRTLYGPGQSAGIPRWTVKYPQIFKAAGYSTALVGKWHLGINLEHREDGHYLPQYAGFDYYYGLPMGNTFMCEPGNQDPIGCFLYENTTVIEQPIVVETIGDRIIDRVKWLIDTMPRPFMLNYWTIYMHTPLFPKMVGRSPRGLYGDTLMELDDHLGAVLSILPEDTWLIFTSDNGPFLEEHPDNGCAGPFKGGKGQVYEGGIRVPFLIYHPSLARKKIHHLTSLMDLFPSLMELANITAPELEHLIIDGESWVPYLYDSPVSTDRFLVHYCGETPIAVRYGQYKVYYAEQIWTNHDAQICPEIVIPVLPYGACGCSPNYLRTLYPPKIYNINVDPGERFPLNSYSYIDIIETASNLLTAHLETVIQVKNQLEAPLNSTLAPCCNYPDCFCYE